MVLTQVVFPLPKAALALALHHLHHNFYLYRKKKMVLQDFIFLRSCHGSWVDEDRLTGHIVFFDP